MIKYLKKNLFLSKNRAVRIDIASAVIMLQVDISSEDKGSMQ